MEILDPVGGSVFEHQHLAGSAVELNAPIMIGKYEFDHPFLRAQVDALEGGGEVCRNGIAEGSDGNLVEAVDGEPGFQIVGNAGLGFGQNQPARLFFPTQQQARE